MFRITKNPSSGSLVQCLAKNYRNDSILSVDMDKVGVMAAYTAITPILCDPKHVRALLYILYTAIT